MPRNGTPRARGRRRRPRRGRWRAAPRRSGRRRPHRAAPPRRAPAASSGSSTSRASAPRCTSAFSAEPQVADAVVEDGDSSVHRHAPSALPNVPLVEGTPPPSTRTASRRQRATPLNDASRMWWVFFPVTRRMCSVIAGGGDEGAPELLGQLRVERRRAQRRHVGPEGHVVGEIGPAREVEGHLDQRLVEGQGDRGEAPDAGLVPERLGQGLAEHDADVLDGVVGVDVEVAGGLDRQVEPAVAAELGEHVVEERDARSPPRPTRCRRGPRRRRWSSPWSGAGASRDARARLIGAGRSGLRRRSRRHRADRRRSPASRASARPSRLERRAARNRSFSSGVPTVTRRQSSSPGQLEQSRTSTDASRRSCHTRWRPRPVGPEQDEVGVRRPRLHGQLAERGGDAAPLLGDERPPAPPWRRRGAGPGARPPG